MVPDFELLINRMFIEIKSISPDLMDYYKFNDGKGADKAKNELKKCFSKKVQKHFGRKFNADLPNELGLSSGKKRVSIMFKIDKTGNVVNIQARAPHPKIKSEVIKVMKQLPKMKPGKQRGKPVGVKYSIPFTLLVE